MDAFARQLRILDDGALSGAENMARDEALLTRVGEGASPPTLRLYQWRAPTISLGYFQRYAEVARLDPPLRELTVVRRLTGGGAILHDLELTYSLALPLGHALLSGGPNALYERAHDAVIRCFEDLDVSAWRGCASDDSGPARGPFFCFARRHCFDVLVGDDKLAGSAQRRTTRAVLQHGSIIVASRFAPHPAALLPIPSASAIETLRAAFPARLTVSNTASAAMGTATGSDLVTKPGAWNKEELSDACDLIPKYAGEAWTRKA